MHGTWTTLTVANKRIDAYDPPTPRFGVLYLHSGGLESLQGNHAFTRDFDALGLACLCPQGGMSWWADRLCPEFDATLTAERFLLDHVVPCFRDRWGFAPPAVGLLGVSMGGQGALRLAFKYPKLFPVVAAISPSIEFHTRYGDGTTLDAMYDSKEQARQDTALLHVHPSQFPTHLYFVVDSADVKWWRGNDRLHEKLTALGVPHTAELTTNQGGHTWDYFNARADRAIRFVAAGLAEMSRRLL